MNPRRADGIYKLTELSISPSLNIQSAVNAASNIAALGPGRTQASQELGEGLTLDGSKLGDGNYNSPNLAETPQWPLQHLERIKQESKVSALVGQNVILNCAVQFKDGVEKPFVVNWLKYPHKLPIYIWYAGYPPHVAQGYENRVSRIGQASLNLTQVRQSDQGLYECKIYYLDRRPEDKGNGTWIFLDVQGEFVLLVCSMDRSAGRLAAALQSTRIKAPSNDRRQFSLTDDKQ